VLGTAVFPRDCKGGAYQSFHLFLLCGVLGAVSEASECQADEHSLLQAQRLVRKTKKTGTDEINEALEAAREAVTLPYHFGGPYDRACPSGSSGDRMA